MSKEWQTKKLGEVCDIFNGSTPLRSKKEFWENGKINWFTIKDIRKQGRVIRETEQKITKKALKESSITLLPTDTILLCCTASVGEWAISKIELTTNQQFNGMVVKNKEELLPEYLFHFSSTLKDKLLSVSGKTTIDFVSMTKLKEIEIPLPPLPEQKRIVKLLDEAFEKLDIAKEKVEANIRNAEELCESYLDEVFSNPGEDWIKTTIGKTCDLNTGGTPTTSKKEYYKNGDIKWLVSGDIHQKEIFDCSGRITALGLENSNARYLPINSVLIALNGQGKTKGTVAMLKAKATCNQSLVSIYPKDGVDILPELIYANLDGRYNEIRKLTGDSGSDRRGLNMPIIRTISFSYPKSRQKQHDIVNNINKLRGLIKKIEASNQNKLISLKKLKKSILQKVFSDGL